MFAESKLAPSESEEAFKKFFPGVPPLPAKLQFANKKPKRSGNRFGVQCCSCYSPTEQNILIHNYKFLPISSAYRTVSMASAAYLSAPISAA